MIIPIFTPKIFSKKYVSAGRGEWTDKQVRVGDIVISRCNLYAQGKGGTLVHYSIYSDKSAIRASGLIPVIPLIVINKDTQLPMYIEEQAINY